jgi:small conductance mechanosensitive channel
MEARTPTPPVDTSGGTPPDDSGTEGGLITEVENEVKVVLDRWSVGQIDWSDVWAAVAVLIVAVGLAFVIRRVIRRSTRSMDGAAASAVSMIGQIASVGIYLFAVAIVLEILGFTLGPVLIVALLAVILLVVLRPVVQNLSAGLVLQLRGLCHPGDLVEVDGEVGVVREVNTRAVVLITADGRLISVPNEQVIATKLVNYSTENRRRSAIVVHVPGDTDVDSLGATILAAFEELPSVLDEPTSRMLVTGFDGGRALVEVQFWHESSLDAETAARDEVGRCLRQLFDTSAFTLSNPTMAVRLPDTS